MDGDTDTGTGPARIERTGKVGYGKPAQQKPLLDLQREIILMFGAHFVFSKSTFVDFDYRNKVKESQQVILKNFDKAKKLREARLKLGLTQVEMARLLNLNSSYLSEFETDKRPIDSWYVQVLDSLLENPDASIRRAKEGGETEGATAIQELETWRRRAKLAEKNLADLRDGLRSLLALSSNLPPAGKVPGRDRGPENPALNETPGSRKVEPLKPS